MSILDKCKIEKNHNDENIVLEDDNQKFIIIPYEDKDYSLFLEYMKNRKYFKDYLAEQEQRESKRKVSKNIHIKVSRIKSNV